MEVEEQIGEDGEIVKSPTKHSPIQLSKDPSTFQVSEGDDAEDTADSLDIKPPQAAVAHHHKSSSRSVAKMDQREVSEDDDAEDTADSLDIKPPQAAVAHHHKSSSRSVAKREQRDKYHNKEAPRDHPHVSVKSEATSVSHRKSHHRSHREHRDERFREKRHHRQHHEGLRESKHEHDFSRGKMKEKSSGDRMLEDLRERLLDKRRAGSKHERRERERREEEEAAMVAAMRETPREKAERMEREIRRERLLEADREMVRQKEVYRRELEARRERHYLEKEKERTLREIVKRRERSRSQERKKRRVEEGEEGDDEMEGKDKNGTQNNEEKKEGTEDNSLTSQLVVVSSESEMDDAEPGDDGKDRSDGEVDGGQEMSSGGDDDDDDDEEEAEEEEDEDDDDDSSTSSETDDDDRDTDVSEGRRSDDEHFHSHVRSPSRSVSRERSGEDTPLKLKKDRQIAEDDEDMVKKQALPCPSPARAPDVHLNEKQAMLPPYLPAIQGCRSVDEFQCLNRIEEGTYGVVYRAKDLRTQEVVALKRLKMEKEKEGFPITSLREINTLLKAQHSNIVTVREIVVGSNMDKIYIVMDYVEHDLKSLMETMKSKKQVFIPGEVKCLMQQLLRAVAHLHDNWILHRDLKTSNLLLSHKGILKVGDFGLAREYGSPLKHYTPIVVTLWYRAPELLLCSKEYSTPIDLWSVGCIFGEFLTMEALFPGKSEVDQLNRIFKDLGTPNEKVWPGYNKLPAVQKMTFTEYPVNQLRQRFGTTMITDTGMELMNRFLTYDPSQRITAEEALKHDYFREAPLPIDPAMFPTWPAKSELGHRKVAASPKPPPGGAEYKQLGDTDEDVGSMGFHMGAVEKGRAALGPGFSLKF